MMLLGRLKRLQQTPPHRLATNQVGVYIACVIVVPAAPLSHDPLCGPK